MKINRIISRIVRGICFFPQTAYINLRTLPFTQAIKLPYIVMGRSSIRGCTRNNLHINGKIKTGMVKIGAQKTSKRGIHVQGKTFLIIDDDGSITFNGEASIGAGTSICAHGGQIVLGDKFSCNNNCFLYSQKSISIGSDVLLGWNISIRDNDGHPIYQYDNVINHDKEIVIGDKTWIASYADILKGVQLPEGTIVGTRSLVTKSVEGKNKLIAGIPAKEIKENVTWDHDFAIEG